MAKGEVHADTEFSGTGEGKSSYIVLSGTYPSSSLRMSCSYRKIAEQKTEEKENTYRKTTWKKRNMTLKTIKKKEKETISLYETNFPSFWYTKTKPNKPEYSMTSEDGIIIIISCDEFIYPKSKTLILDFSYENTSKTTILLPSRKKQKPNQPFSKLY